MLIKKRVMLALAFCFSASVITAEAKSVDLASPNGKIVLTLDFSNTINYKVSYNDEVLLDDCSLQLDLQHESLGKNPKVSSMKREKVSEVLTPHVPLKFSQVKKHTKKQI